MQRSSLGSTSTRLHRQNKGLLHWALLKLAGVYLEYREAIEDWKRTSPCLHCIRAFLPVSEVQRRDALVAGKRGDTYPSIASHRFSLRGNKRLGAF